MQKALVFGASAIIILTLNPKIWKEVLYFRPGLYEIVHIVYLYYFEYTYDEL